MKLFHSYIDIKMASLEMELEQGEESLGDDILNLSTADIQARTRLLDNEVGRFFLNDTKYSH